MIAPDPSFRDVVVTGLAFLSTGEVQGSGSNRIHGRRPVMPVLPERRGHEEGPSAHERRQRDREYRGQPGDLLRHLHRSLLSPPPFPGPSRTRLPYPWLARGL